MNFHFFAKKEDYLINIPLKRISFHILPKMMICQKNKELAVVISCFVFSGFEKTLRIQFHVGSPIRRSAKRIETQS